ncbi:hypothetical protein CJ739_665 [Mariniflexile rhizosphaerae]|uniref:ABC-three component system protein n=1 Tax=unclassified Mariniflexile TaxID=2643887 RepID=UPI000E337516|nr:ABC-three component system protein [Mariniflexile sp. TRM1-10]AXP79762.1 hypothetical protein CJ739_665 [Mariniflexile sp. TRM1-10]
MSFLHDATPTWNGFNYQGKIALLVVLDKLIELKKNGDSIDEFHLELEWLEDFSIKKNNDYISIHQVKNYGDNNLNSYDEALLSLLCKSLNTFTTNELTQVITQKGLTKEEKSNLAIEIYNELNNAKISLFDCTQIDESSLLNFSFPNKLENKFKDHTKVLFRLKEVIKHYVAIAQNCTNLENSYIHVAEEVTDFTMDNIKNLTLIIESSICKNINFETALKQIKLYKYDHNIFNCTNDDLESFLILRLKNLISILEPHYKPDFWKIQDVYLAKVICMLSAHIDKHVNKRHQAIREKKTDKIDSIKFTDFVQIISENHNQSDDYDAFILKDIYTKSLEEFLNEKIEDDEICKYLIKVSDFHLKTYSGKSLIEFCQKIAPQTKNLSIKSSLLEDSGIRNSFFEFFSKCGNDKGVDICFQNADNESCVVTTIHETNFNPAREQSIYNRIKANSKQIPYNFNVESFAGCIGKGNGGKKFNEVLSNQTKAPLVSKIIPLEKIMVSQNFKIIDINDLIDKLK